MNIKLLSPITINRIAAGEVIERPSAALKELLENSIDSGASQLDIDIKQGGKNLIAVKDNGSGMSKLDLSNCIKRHATSKLPDDDLLNINNFGFRGEALPSIGSVSRMSISSFDNEQKQGWQIDVEGGIESETKPSNITEGTRVEVRDLFFATPARLKFLKTDRTEIASCIEKVNQLAMAYPDIGFSVRIDNRDSINLKAEQDELINKSNLHLDRISKIIGKDFADNAVHIDEKREGIHLKGFVAVPTYNRGNSLHQYLFVNNRPVKDKLILGAIKGAYQDFLARGRFPVVALFINIESDQVDVNVHPAKSEVRFRESNLVRGLIVASIKRALANKGNKASTTFAKETLDFFKPGIQPIFTDENKNILREKKESSYEAPKNYSNLYQGDYSKKSFKKDINQSIFKEEDIAPAAQSFTQYKNEEKDYSSFPMGAATCQLHKTYIVAQAEDGIVIVDQHAAHERLVYENMKSIMGKDKVKTQILLIPEVVELGEKEINALLEKQDSLTNAGLVFENFGNYSILVKEIPAILGECNVKNLIQNITDDICEVGEALSLDEKIEHIVGTIACHGSIRAGREMNIKEMNALLRQMETTPHSGQCNHGRPTYVKLQLKDVEKLFGRR